MSYYELFATLLMIVRKRGVSFLEAENGAIGVNLFQNEMTANKGVKGFDVVLMGRYKPLYMLVEQTVRRFTLTPCHISQLITSSRHD